MKSHVNGIWKQTYSIRDTKDKQIEWKWSRCDVNKTGAYLNRRMRMFQMNVIVCAYFRRIKVQKIPEPCFRRSKSIQLTHQSVIWCWCSWGWWSSNMKAYLIFCADRLRAKCPSPSFAPSISLATWILFEWKFISVSFFAFCVAVKCSGW